MLYIHKDYDGQFFNNIAVLELDRKVSFLNGVNVIGISTNTSNVGPGDVLSLYGWDKVSDLPWKESLKPVPTKETIFSNYCNNIHPMRYQRWTFI